jgi:hypothetical protein
VSAQTPTPEEARAILAKTVKRRPFFASDGTTRVAEVLEVSTDSPHLQSRDDLVALREIVRDADERARAGTRLLESLPSTEELGRAAYEAFTLSLGNEHTRAKWRKEPGQYGAELPEHVRAAWRETAAAVVRAASELSRDNLP